MSNDFAAALGLPRNRGEIVQSVVDGEAAARLHVREPRLLIVEPAQPEHAERARPRLERRRGRRAVQVEADLVNVRAHGEPHGMRRYVGLGRDDDRCVGEVVLLHCAEQRELVRRGANGGAHH